jgi:hypothetical protein
VSMSWLCMYVCAGPCLDVELPDGAPAVIRQLFGRVLQEAVRQEGWANASILLDALGQQQALPQQLQDAGYWHSTRMNVGVYLRLAVRLAPR